MFFTLLQSQVNSDVDAQGTQILFILLGMFIVFILLFVWKVWESIMKARERPHVFFIDLSVRKVRYMGQYVDRIDFDLEVERGNKKPFWGIRTSTGDGYVWIVPSFGNWEDMVMWDQSELKGFVFILGIIIGTGAESTDVHKQWMDDAFPPDIFEFDQPTAIPPQFILCKPLWNRNMERVTFQQNVMGIHNVFTLFNKMINIQDQQMQMIHEHYSTLLLSRITVANDHLLSQWEYILQAWNTLHKERTVPLFVLSQLLHISPSRVTYTGLASALNQGGIQAAAPFLSNIKSTLEDVAESLDLTMMEKGNTEMLFQKVNSNKEELMNLAQQNMQYEKDLRRLMEQNQRMQMALQSGSGGAPAAETPDQGNQPIAMQSTPRAPTARNVRFPK